MCTKAELEELENETAAADVINQQMEDLSEEAKERAARKNRLRQKIISLGRMNMMLGNLRANSETILKMKQVSMDGKLPRGLLLKDKASVKFDLE
jgi:hypothetical protein